VVERKYYSFVNPWTDSFKERKDQTKEKDKQYPNQIRKIRCYYIKT
jgi:hypothetical protein